MLHENTAKYESRLVAIANTRLMFNTIEELEVFLGNHSIKSNGIRRCFATKQKLRSAYRDLKVESMLLTDELFDLDWLMCHYERAWIFYKTHLARRKNPHIIAKALINVHYGKHRGMKPGKTMAALQQKIDECNVNVAILSLLLLKAIPGYDSKPGNVTDIDTQFERAIGFLEDFTSGCGIYDALPAINNVRNEKFRTRFMLIYHTVGVLNVYEAFSDVDNITQTSQNLKSRRVALDIDGFWNDDRRGIF